LYEGLAEVPEIQLTKPDGAFYLFPNFTELIPRSVQEEDRKTYIHDTLMKKGVAAVFGACFGRHFVDNIRFSFSTTPDVTIREGVARIREVFA